MREKDAFQQIATTQPVRINIITLTYLENDGIFSQQHFNLKEDYGTQ